jgi:hypothetical protein
MKDPTPRPDLTNLDDEEIIEQMINWFGMNYENPAEMTPYESREGGYIYIWGGPFYAREELETYFPNISEILIEQATEIIEHEGTEWAPASNRIERDD